MTLPRTTCILRILFLLGSVYAGGQSATHDLSELSLGDLMNVEVTSASKKEQKMSQVASAMFVITQDDIRRSGATNIPDLLRMVPGLDVAQINANTWAISARGFNHQFSDKLLVLIDSRTVLSMLYAGVFWDTQDVPLEDIDRIEVIRGPGATIWGETPSTELSILLRRRQTPRRALWSAPAAVPAARPWARPSTAEQSASGLATGCSPST